MSPYFCVDIENAILTLLEKWRVVLDNKGFGLSISGNKEEIIIASVRKTKIIE